MDENNAIVEINKAELALERANDIHEMLVLRDTAAAYELLANAQGFKDAAQKAKIFQLKAERKAGDWLAVNINHDGNKFGVELQDVTPLPEGVSKIESHRWQLEASLPEEKFNEWVDDSLAKGYEISASGLQKLAKNHNVEVEKIAKQQEKKDIEISRLIINGDFRTSKIQAESVDLIITDPPYGREFSDTWTGLSSFANRVLKPSAFLISYFGQLNMPDFINSLSKELIYYWTFSLQHSGNNQLVMPRNIFCGWKPIFIFQKPPFKKLQEPMDDVIAGTGREKSEHKWQQAEKELNYLIDRFSDIGDLIVDPFCGSGTTLVAALKKNRNVVGIEIDEYYCKVATERINGIQG